MYFEGLKQEVIDQWWLSGATFTNFKPLYTKKNDQALITLKDQMKLFIDHIIKNGRDSENEKVVLEKGKIFMEQTIGISPWSADTLFSEAYLTCSEAFVKRAKIVAPDLSTVGIFQALRNLWTMNSMQIYLNSPIQLTDAMFAYSMLYPLTDNYLDSPERSKAEKYNFNGRFRTKIATGEADAFTPEESRIFEMIDLIAGDFDRVAFPSVYEALLAILDGQNMSLHQQDSPGPYQKDILGISIYKGGSSVLADAYLIKGTLTPEQERFAFYYGVLLQFADDLQDLKTDAKEGHATIFNLQVKHGHLEALACKYLNLMTHFFETIFEPSSDQSVALKEIMSKSLELLIFTALIEQRRYLSRTFLNQVKQGSCFSHRTYIKVEKQFRKQLKKITQNYGGQIFAIDKI